MIVNCTFRGPGGLAAHLQRTDTNESVCIRDDLSCGCALDIDDAVADFAAIGEACGAQKSLIHFSISPTRPLTGEQERQMAARIRSVYAIPDDHPVLVVMHHKPGETDRPAHYHLVFPRAVVARKQIKSGHSHIKNERVSLELEFDFNHPLVPGPNIDAVRNTLRNDRPDMTAAFKDLEAPPRKNNRATVGDKNFAVESGVEILDFDRRVYDAWLSGAFADREQLAGCRLSIAHGRTCAMVIDTDTGYSQSLQRVINRESKRQGKPENLKQKDVAARLHALDPTEQLSDVRRGVIRSAATRAPTELRRAMLVEQAVNPSATGPIRASSRTAPAEPASQASEPDTDQSVWKRSRPNTIAADLEIMRRCHRELIESRKRAARRAWRSARIWRSRDVQTFVKWAAAGATIASGGGLLLAVAAAGLAARLAAARGRRKLEAAQNASQAIRLSQTQARADMDAYFERVRSVRGFDLSEIPKHARVAAGYVHWGVSHGQALRPDVIAALEVAAPGLQQRIADVAQFSSSVRLASIFEAMYRPGHPTTARALKNFVKRQSQPPPAPHLRGAQNGRRNSGPEL